MGIPRMIKPFICFFILFLSIIINYQGSSKTYLAQTSDGNDDGMNKSNENGDYSRVKICESPWGGREWGTDYPGNNIRAVRIRGSSRQCACICQALQDVTTLPITNAKCFV